jgi:hypothetical protein
VFGLSFGFDFYRLKTNKGRDLKNNFFSKSRLSRSVKLKAFLYLLLAAFG